MTPIESDQSKSSESSKAYEAESEIIKRNQNGPGGKPHKFKAAEWTYLNGHPRCIMCGDEETESGECPGHSSGAAGIGKLNALIESEEVTSNDFNLFIEGLPKSTVEKVQRRTRLKPGTPLRPKDHSPVKKAEAKLQKIGDNDPTRTGRGKISVRRQGEDNKKHANRFREAIEFILKYNGKQIDEETPVIQDIEDKEALSQLVLRLLATSDIHINREWLHKIRQLND